MWKWGLKNVSDFLCAAIAFICGIILIYFTVKTEMYVFLGDTAIVALGLAVSFVVKGFRDS